MPFPESFNDGPIPSSSKREGETREILLADLSYSNQACLKVSSEVIVCWIRTNSQGMRLQRQAYPYPKHVVQIYPKNNNNTQTLVFVLVVRFLDMCDVQVSTQFSICTMMDKTILAQYSHVMRRKDETK